MPTLTIIGCGNVGRTLARLWAASDTFDIRQVLNRTRQSGRAAVRFVGAGAAIERIADVQTADAVMICTSDDAIEPVAKRLREAGVVADGTIVFHCSGTLPSAVLDEASAGRWRCASMHPIMSFASPSTAVESVAGTYCSLEGDPAALALLQWACHAVGIRTFKIDPRFKTIYHAGSVVACNYLVAIVEVGIRCFQKAGIPEETAIQLIGPIAHATIDNVGRLGTVRALTGPIARGEREVVAAQCEALLQWEPEMAALYKALGRVAAELSEMQGSADREALLAIRELLG